MMSRHYPNGPAVRHLHEARKELFNLAQEATGSPEERLYEILLTVLEKLIHVEAGYFQNDD